MSMILCNHTPNHNSLLDASGMHQAFLHFVTCILLIRKFLDYNRFSPKMKRAPALHVKDPSGQQEFLERPAAFTLPTHRDEG